MTDINIHISGKTFSLNKVLIPYIIKPLFVIFIYYAMFSRVSGLLGLTGGMTAVLISAALFSLTCLHMFVLTDNNNVSVIVLLVFLFFVTAAFTPLVSGFIYNERLFHIIRYVIELGISFAIFFFIYYLVREQVVSPKFIVYTIAVMGAITAIQILASVVGMTSLHRVGGEVAGLNYIGNTLAVSAITFIYIMNAKSDEKWKRRLAITFFIVVFLALLFTGTRAGMIAFLGGLVLYQMFGLQSRRLTKYAFIFLVIIAVLVIIVSTQINLQFLFQRYTYDSLERMALIRFNMYYGSVADLTYVEFLFGRADLAALDASLEDLDRFINPHNVFLSLIRFNGLIPFLIFFTVFVILYVNYFKIYFKRRSLTRYRIFETTIIVFLSTSFINVMFSGGKFTRNFFLFFAIGYAVGYIDLLRKMKSEEEYSELIL